MRKIKQIFRYIFRMNFSNMFKIIKKVSKKSGKCQFIIFFDMIICGFKYGAGYYDYQEFEFYNLNKNERQTYLTRIKNNNIIKNYNNREFFDKFDNKATFNKLFNKYLKRDYLVINEKNYNEFAKFMMNHKEVIVKPIDGEGGKGVSKIILDKKTNLNDLYQSLLEKKQVLIEECIKQNKDINTLYSGAVNSLRLFTFFDGTNSYVLNSVFKIGNGGVTDNFSSGSMYTFIDEKGIIMVSAIDQNDNIYNIHPITKVNIVGFKVPFYQEACNLVKEAAKIVPEVKYVGWDVAITNEGPVIIEGNSFPGVFQIKPSLKKGMGLIPIYQKYMDIK